MANKLRLELTEEAVALVLNALGEQPYARVAEHIHEIHRQATSQLTPPKDPAPAPVDMVD